MSSHYSTPAALLGFLVVLFAAAGCGMALLRALRAESDSVAERFVLGSAAGFGLLAYAILAVGLLGWLRPPVLLALVLIEAVVGVRALAAWAQEARLPSRSRKLTDENENEKEGGLAPNASDHRPDAQRSTASIRRDRIAAAALVSFCLFVAGVTLIGALAPPNGDDWDSLAYHLAAPRIYLAHGRIAYIPYDSHTDFPFTLEMLYTLGLTYGGAAGAKLFHWATGCLTALAIASFCRRLFPATGDGVRMPVWGPPLAAALFLSIPQVQWLATTAYIDLGTALFQFLALAAFFYAVSAEKPAAPTQPLPSPSVSPCLRGTSQMGWLVVSGLMSGWAAGTKMTALIPFGLLVLAGAVWAALGRINTEIRGPKEEEKRGRGEEGVLPSSPLPSRWAGVAAMALVGILVASPWYIKSYLWTNDPVYPFFYSLFPRSLQWTYEAEKAYRHEQGFFGLGKGAGDLLMAPWNLAMQGWAYFTVLSRQADPGTLPYFDGLRRGGLSASFLGLVPLAVFTRRWDRRLTGLVVYSLALLLPWFVLSQQSRYLLPVTAPLAVVAAAVVANLEADLPRWTAAAFVALVLLLHASWGWGQILVRTLPVVAGNTSRKEYLERTFAPYAASEFLNRLPPGSKVALYQETRGFYIDRPYLWANPLQNTLVPYDRFTHGAELVRFLRQQLGVTHVLINTNGLEGTENTGWYRLLKDAIDHGGLIPVFEARGVYVYAITS